MSYIKLLNEIFTIFPLIKVIHVTTELHIRVNERKFKRKKKNQNNKETKKNPKTPEQQ